MCHAAVLEAEASPWKRLMATGVPQSRVARKTEPEPPEPSLRVGAKPPEAVLSVSYGKTAREPMPRALAATCTFSGRPGRGVTDEVMAAAAPGE